MWGCLAYCKSTKPKRTKLGPRSFKCAFVGYASNSKAYRLLDLESNMIIEPEKLEFFENMLYCDRSSQEPTSVGESFKEKDPKVDEQPILPRRIQMLKELGLIEKCSQVETLRIRG